MEGSYREGKSYELLDIDLISGEKGIGDMDRKKFNSFMLGLMGLKRRENLVGAHSELHKFKSWASKVWMDCG
jgi:hypothetical protein